MLALLLFVLGQLRAVFRTLRDGRPFVPANAARIRWIAFAVIAGELVRAVVMYSANSYVMTHFTANGLRFDARPDVNVIDARSWVSHSRDRGSLQDRHPPGRRPVPDNLRDHMAIRVKLDHLLLDRRLTLTELADRIGITIANLSVLKTNKAKAVRFSTLEAVCRELNCQPGDLLEWTREEP